MVCTLKWNSEQDSFSEENVAVQTLIELETAAAPAPTPTPTPETSDSAPTPSSKPVEPPSQQFPVAAAASPLGITEPRSGGTAVSDDPTNSNNTPSTEPSEELETGSPGQGGGGGGGGGSGVSTEAIVGGVAAVAAVCLAAVFAAIVFKRRKAARKGQAEHKKQEVCQLRPSAAVHMSLVLMLNC